MTVIKKFDHQKLNSVGSKVLVEKKLSSNPREHLPPWFNLEKFKEAKSLINRYFFSLLFAHLSGLILLIFIPSIHRTLSKTGKSKNVVALFFRYFDTCLHVKKWYEGKIWDPNDEAFHSLLKVKKMHQAVSDKQNQELKVSDEKALSQLDMSLTQFAFVGLIILGPKKCGFSTNLGEINKLIYFWRVIGYMIGIKDEFNLLSSENYDEICKNLKKISDDNFHPYLINMDGDSKEMANQIMIAMNGIVHLITFKPLFNYLMEILKIEPLPFNLDKSEMFIFNLLKNIMEHLIHYSIIAFILNNSLRLSLFKFNLDWILQYQLRRLRAHPIYKTK